MNTEDIQAILDRRYDQGWDYWTTEDRRLGKGAPFSCLESAEYLLEPADRSLTRDSATFMGKLAGARGFQAIS